MVEGCFIENKMTTPLNNLPKTDNIKPEKGTIYMTFALGIVEYSNL